MELFASIDQGTSSTRTIIFDKDLKSVDSRQEAYELNFPNPGWVEIDPEVLRNSVMNTMQPLVDKYKDKLNSISITNQRESTIIWNKKTGKAIYPIIVWQDRRTEGYCNKLKEQGHESMIQNKTGLVIDPYFSATKIKWILENVPSAQDQAKKGEILFGTIDCYLVWLLTGKHVTDSTNASRTMIFNIQNQCWDDELLKLFCIPRDILPEVTASNFEFGKCKNSGLKLNAVIGDQQAALVGQQCFNKNSMKVTFGTGCFLMMNMGREFRISNKKLLTTIAYKFNDQCIYGMEGSIFSAGTIIKWLRDNLNFFNSAKESESHINPEWNSNGVLFVPAFTGLGVPQWNPNIKASFYGITAENDKNDLVTAAFKSIVYQLKDILMIIKEDGYDISSLSIDGGMSNNRKFCQMISDILGLEILVPENVESTATGAAIVSSIRDVKQDLKDLPLPSYTKYLPKGNSCEADFQEWQKFVQTLDQQYK